MTLAHLVRNDTGQDLIEYGLLIGIVAMGVVTVLPSIATKMGAAFVTWGNNINNQWIPEPPQ
jgi:Flp pilus assembly pilin Flp